MPATEGIPYHILTPKEILGRGEGAGTESVRNSRHWDANQSTGLLLSGPGPMLPGGKTCGIQHSVFIATACWPWLFSEAKTPEMQAFQLSSASYFFKKSSVEARGAFLFMSMSSFNLQI